MERYENLSGSSGVTAYELTPDGIKVQFAGGAVYLYTSATLGRETIDHMEQLAVAGRGLATYISQNVKKADAVRLP